MELWMKIGSAILLVTMLVIIFPQAKRMMKESPEGSASDWMTALIPIGLVAVFIIFLILIV